MGVNSLHWYYLPSLGEPGDVVSLSGDEWHHCYHVVRLTAGDTLILVDGQGSCMEGIIKSTSQHEGTIELTNDRHGEFQNPRNYKLSIGIAPTKNIDRTEFAVEKLVELGVDEICFLDCKHAERKHVRLDRFEKIIVAAAKQSRKIVFPSLIDLTSPEKYILHKRKEQPDLNILCCHLDASGKSVFENYSHSHDVVMLVGPEGGFSIEELEKMNHLGVRMVHLGPFRLRVETAAIVACADIHLINEMNNRI
jgi:16S rRNA (uracil1498-N3)-methyltransferase